ncbi:hypothetical protein EVAR_48468_1 [Eumeta japonica]|uniref:Uncharacterized protein n=1 Tax=Eumeta variegata TaxID=151549 RepID=A0A4C1XJB7_EUMVA|nr:hypothetical protein EVAR_48468_1 [Eumeta japonica]
MSLLRDDKAWRVPIVALNPSELSASVPPLSRATVGRFLRKRAARGLGAGPRVRHIFYLGGHSRPPDPIIIYLAFLHRRAPPPAAPSEGRPRYEFSAELRSARHLAARLLSEKQCPNFPQKNPDVAAGRPPARAGGNGLMNLARLPSSQNKSRYNKSRGRFFFRHIQAEQNPDMREGMLQVIRPNRLLRLDA